MAISFKYCLLALFVATGLSLLALCIPAIFTQHDLSHPESIVPWGVKEIASGRPLYSDWRQWPHRFMPYGPMLCYPAGLALRWLHIPDFGFHLYLIGRIQTLFYLIGMAFVMASLLPTRRFWWAVVYALAGLSLWPGLMVPGMSFRGDAPALFWVLLAASIAFHNPANRRMLALALICFGLSLAYRPALWSFPAAFCVYSMIQKRTRLALSWCAAVVVFVAAYMIIGNALTNGRFLLNQIGASSIGLTADIYRMIFATLMSHQDSPLLTWDLALRLVVALFVAIYLAIKSKRELDRGVAVYYVCSLLVNLITLFKVGAGLNYIVEAYVLSLVILAIAAIRLWENRTTLAIPTKISAITTVTFLLFIPMLYFTWANFKMVPQIIRGIPMLEVYQPLQRLPDSALLGDLSFTNPSVASHALSDPVPYTKLAMKDMIPREPLLSRLSSHAFSYIVLSPGTKYLFFGPNGIPWAGEAIKANYVCQTSLPEYEIWVPLSEDKITSHTADIQPPL